MLEGLEIVEVTKQECENIIDFRIDANTYKKEYIRTAKLLKENNCTNIESLSNSVQNFGAYSLCSFINFTDYGIPFLMTENIRHNFIDWNVERFVDEDSHKMLWKSHCKKEQILITMAGEYLGRVSVYDKDFICSSNQAIAKVTLKENNNPYYISTFLNSKYGQNQINRFKTITGQPNINMSLIKELEIIILTRPFQNEIEKIVKQSHNNLEQSKTLYTQAEQILLEELGFYNSPPMEGLGVVQSIKTFKESYQTSSRLDAEYYQPKYDEILKAIRGFKNGFANLKALIKEYSTGFPFESESYVSNGFSLIRINNIKKGELDLSNANQIPAANINLSIKDVVKENDLLLSMSGTIGNCCKIPSNTKAIINQRILRFSVQNFDADVLCLYINSVFGASQLERVGTGGVQTNISSGDIFNVEIPLILQETQTQISNLIQQSFQLRQQSKHLLEVAKQAVETAIEQNETLAIDFINNKLVKYQSSLNPPDITLQ